MKRSAVEPTYHATAFLLGAAGVLIRGASGAGKSCLALALIDEAAARGGFAALVADDRVHLDAWHGRLVARTPSGLAGLVERRGSGIERHPCETAAVIRLVVDLVGAVALPRLPEPADQVADILGLVLPRLALSPTTPGSTAAVRAALGALSDDARAFT